MIAVVVPKPTDIFSIHKLPLYRYMMMALGVHLSLAWACFGCQNTVSTPSEAISAVDQDSQWVQPIALIRDLESIEEYPLAAHWAASTRQIIKQLELCDSLADPDCQLVFSHLKNQLEQLEFLIGQITNLPLTDDRPSQTELTAHSESCALCDSTKISGVEVSPQNCDLPFRADWRYFRHQSK